MKHNNHQAKHRGFRNTFLGAGLASTVFIACWDSALAADSTPIPVPKHVVYAGQLINSDILRDRTVPNSYLNRVSVIVEWSQVVGKVARTTLAPNRPIPTNQIIEPDVVKVNRPALLRYSSGTLVITAEVVPLNSSKTGGLVRARNSQTGIIVSGIAQADGTIAAGISQ